MRLKETPFCFKMLIFISAFIGLGRKVGYVFIVINIIGAVYYYFFSLNTMLTIITAKTNFGLIAELLELIFAFFVVTYLMSKFSEFQKMSEKDVEIAHQETEVKSNENEFLVLLNVSMS